MKLFNKKIIVLLFMFILTFSFSIQAQVDTEERTVTSYGNTKSEAIVNALIEAVQQVQGVEIEALKKSLWSTESNISEKNGDVETDFENNNKIKEDISTYTQGNIEEYEILNTKQLSDDKWEVKVKVYVSNYDGEINWKEEKANLAVIPFRVDSSIGYNNINVENMASRLNSNLESTLANSNFFRLLNRKYEDEFQDEKEMLLSEDMSSKERARLGERLGADFLLTGDIIGINSNYDIVDFYGLEVLKYNIEITAEVRALNFATGEMMWGDTISINSSGISQKNIDNRGDILNQLIPDLVDQLSQKLNNGLLDSLMPMYVIDVSGDKVYLNQGKDRLELNEILSVLGEARKINDPHSSEDIIIEGEEIAKLRITEIRDDYSVAEVLNRNSDKIKTGLTVERIAQVTREENKSIFIPEFTVKRSDRNVLDGLISPPPSQTIHMELLESSSISDNIKIISTGGIRNKTTQKIYAGIEQPSYVLLGSLNGFEIEVIDEISGMFFTKYAVEFRGEISWEILDENGNKVIVDKGNINKTFEVEADSERKEELLNEIDKSEIEEEINKILEEIKIDMEDRI